MISRTSMKSARIVLIGFSVLTTFGTVRFSIRRFDLFCHRSTKMPSQFLVGTVCVSLRLTFSILTYCLNYTAFIVMGW